MVTLSSPVKSPVPPRSPILLSLPRFLGFSSSKLSNVHLPYSLYPLLQFWWSTQWIVSTISNSQPWSLLQLTHFFVVASSLFRYHEGAHGHLKYKVPPFPGKWVLFFPLDRYYCSYLFPGPQAFFSLPATQVYLQCCLSLLLLYYSSSSLCRASPVVCLYNLSFPLILLHLAAVLPKVQLWWCHPSAQVLLNGSLLPARSPNSDMVLTRSNFPALSPTKTQQNSQSPDRNFVVFQ